MEPKFQTSFIPKRPLGGAGSAGSIGGLGGTIPRSPRPRSGVSIFLVLAIFLFVLSLAGVGGAYFWKQYLVSNKDAYIKDLKSREESFPLNEIADLKRVNVQIDAAKDILAHHLSVTQIFKIIADLTIESVRFLTLDVTAPANAADDLKVELKGYGANLFSVAFQSQVFGSLDLYHLQNIVKNPIMSDPTLNPNGTVSFGFTATVDPSSITYERLVNATSSPI
ncbi:MAG: hypothetical protein QOG91_318 [Candidatus Parcubacteria bacterium]|jgi:hypothetical protein|nr:hypothetical protein [Candidatus Parcubacteria bacterium]